MIKYVNSKEETMIEVEGNLTEILTDVATLIHSVYERLKEQSEKAGKMFKENFEEASQEGIFFMTNEELGKVAKERLIKSMKDNARDVLKMMREILEEVNEDGAKK